MRMLAPLVAALGAAFAVSSAQALVLVVDDFSQPIPGVQVNDNDGVADTSTQLNTSALVSSRTLSHTLLTAGPAVDNSLGGFSKARIGDAPNFLPGRLNMSNDTDIDSNVGVTWTLQSIAASVPAVFALDIFNSDPGTTGSVNTAEAFLNGFSLGSFNANSNTTLYWALTAPQAASLLTAGQVFSISFNGADAWDMSVDNLRLEIPEPASLALVGLALVGAGVASRRRKA